MSTSPRVVGAVVFPGFELLDLYGPLEIYAMMSDRFEIRMIGETGAPVAARGGPATLVDDAIATGAADRAYDILLVPGGFGTRREVDNPVLTGWLAEAAARAELVTSVCTGAALLARAGLLDGRGATTNKMSWDWATAHGPAARWQRQARWVEDGNVITSAGVSAGIDMTLAVIARLIDRETAEAVARAAEYVWWREADRDAFG
ncbi:DJ-1/PfpI family protein [Microbaculum marinum]|uniref:DJ-1/PfpI family protein n=1 Tax=Microbaculum marinum TaxID=1764581 RepID=A0AAW9RGU3_9HYPH